MPQCLCREMPCGTKWVVPYCRGVHYLEDLQAKRKDSKQPLFYSDLITINSVDKPYCMKFSNLCFGFKTIIIISGVFFKIKYFQFTNGKNSVSKSYEQWLLHKA